MMSGWSASRIVDDITKIENNLLCLICRCIMNNPVMTECGHNFCLKCISDAMNQVSATTTGATTAAPTAAPTAQPTAVPSASTNASKKCPKCRLPLPVDRTPAADVLKYSRIRVHEVVVVHRNIALKAYIDTLTIRCDYLRFGCNHVTEVQKMAAHERKCKHTSCPDCGTSVESPERHKCHEILSQKVAKLEARLESGPTLVVRQRRIDGKALIVFGAFKTTYGTLNTASNIDGIKLKGVKPRVDSTVSLTIEWPEISRLFISIDDRNGPTISIWPTERSVSRLNAILDVTSGPKNEGLNLNAKEKAKSVITIAVLGMKTVTDAWAQALIDRCREGGGDQNGRFANLDESVVPALAFALYDQSFH